MDGCLLGLFLGCDFKHRLFAVEFSKEVAYLHLALIEQRILRFIKEIEQTLEQKVLQEVQESTVENCVREVSARWRLSSRRNRRFRDRIGAEVVLLRRFYKFHSSWGRMDPPG